MARFGQGLIQALTNPSYQQGMFNLGSAIGSAPAVRREQEAQEAQNQAIRGLFSGAVAGDLTQQGMAQAIQNRNIPIESAIQAAKLQNVINPRKVTRAEYFAKNPNEEAELYEKFTADSVNNYITGKGALVPIPAQDKTKLSSHGQRLQEAGLVPGSPEYKQAMMDFNDSLVSGRAKGISYKGPLEQTSFLTEQFRKHPLYESTNNILEKINKANSVRNLVVEGKSEAIRLMERTVSELYNSDSRAASEIDRLLEGRGIKTNFANWASTALTGDVSNTTKQNLFDILEKAEELARSQQKAAVKDIQQSYGEYVDPNVINNWVKQNETTSFVDFLTEEDAVSLYLQ